MDENELMDTLLQKYTLIEMASTLLKDIAVKSGLMRKQDADESEEDIKNS